MSKRLQSRRPEGRATHPLFVGATRPAMAMGVPYVALLMIGFVTLELFLVTRNLLWVLVALPLYALCWLVCLAEPRFFDLLAVRGTVRLRAGLARHRRWRATSYGALPKVALRRREMPTSVVVESAECGS